MKRTVNYQIEEVTRFVIKRSEVVEHDDGSGEASSSEFMSFDERYDAEIAMAALTKANLNGDLDPPQSPEEENGPNLLQGSPSGAVAAEEAPAAEQWAGFAETLAHHANGSTEQPDPADQIHPNNPANRVD